MSRWAVAPALLLIVFAVVVTAYLFAARHAKTKVLGLNKVIAFTYSPNKDFDVKQLHSVTLIDQGDWKYWQSRGVVMGFGHAWQDLMRSPIDKAVDILTGQDHGGDPHPVTLIDEFGFDYGGLMDQKAAQILRRTKLKKPELSLAVFEMRGPIPQVLAEAYRDVVDLVMMEGYVGNQRQYWWIACQLWSARRYGILPKTIVILGLGKGGNPGENWAETKQELEEQIRFIRMIAPESPGVGFFAGNPQMLAAADELCAHFFQYPAKGTGLPEDVRALARTFSGPHEKPTLVVSPDFVEPDFNENGQGIADPKGLRAYLINLGDEDAHDVKVRLRNPPDSGGNVFAEAVVPVIPKRSEAVGFLPLTGMWRVWVGQWILEVEAPGCDVISYKM